MKRTRTIRRNRAPQASGFDRLLDACKRHLEEQFAEHTADPWGDSEIEKLMLVALEMRLSVFQLGDCITELLLVPDDEVARRMQAMSERQGRAPIIILPQYQLPNWRVDYLARARCFHTDSWRTLIIECDGHDFHERTKEQAARDRGRDRDAQMLGYSIFRFTGSEIWRDAWGCADRIVDWAMKGI